MSNYSTPLVGRARKLRKGMTEVEIKLWSQLRGRRLLGYKFRRQVPIIGYILDFYCSEKKLAVELDGSQHLDNVNQRRWDVARDAELVALGIRTLIFTNNEINENLEGVLEVIIRECEAL